MNPSLAGTLGIAAALAGTLARASTASADLPAPDPVTRDAGATVDPLDPETRPGEHELETAAMTRMCDLKCQVLAFTDDTVPGLGATQVLYTILYPRQGGLSIPKRDGTKAVTFTILPTQIARGKGLIATGTF